jgi:hypothetical protein
MLRQDASDTKHSAPAAAYRRIFFGLLITLIVASAALPAASAAASTGAAGRTTDALPSRSSVTPALFEELSTGIAYITTYTCGGRKLAVGTGFLVGESVVMTARHVLQGSCRIRVKVAGTRFAGGHWTSWWWKTPATRELVDLATLKLNGVADGHIFRFRTSSPVAGANLAMLGYPLGNRISLNQGKIVSRASIRGVPIFAVKMLGAEGASGSPFVDDAGRVVGILQIGLGSKDVLGQRTAGLLLGVEIARWWGDALRRALCGSYPNGGIAGCPGSPTTRPPPPPPPSPDYTLQLTPPSTSVQAGGTADFVVSYRPLNGFNSRIAVDVAGLPAPGSVTWGSVTSAGLPFTIHTNGMSPGTYTFKVVGTSGALSRTVDGTLTIIGPPPTVSEAWLSTDPGGINRITSFSASAPITVYLQIRFQPALSSYTVQTRWINPVGQVVLTTPAFNATVGSTSTWQSVNFPAGALQGNWRAQWVFEDAVVAEVPFSITS